MTDMLRSIMKILSNPLYNLTLIVALIRGLVYLIYYRVARPRIKIGFPFKVFGSVKICGNGSVTIGSNCSVYKNTFSGLCIITLSQDSVVTIGNGCVLGGLTIRCLKRIIVGDDALIGNSLLQDTWVLNSDKIKCMYYQDEIFYQGPIIIGKNVWVSVQTCVLGGSTIGNDCVLAAGTLCNAVTFKDNSLIVGSPAQKSLPISGLLNLREPK